MFEEFENIEVVCPTCKKTHIQIALLKDLHCDSCRKKLDTKLSKKDKNTK